MHAHVHACAMTRPDPAKLVFGHPLIGAVTAKSLPWWGWERKRHARTRKLTMLTTLAGLGAQTVCVHVPRPRPTPPSWHFGTLLLELLQLKASPCLSLGDFEEHMTGGCWVVST